MKVRIVKVRIAATLALVGFAFPSFAAVWTYDADSSTITDGNWTLAVTANGNELTIASQSASLVAQNGTGVIDFSDGVEAPYTIVALEKRAFRKVSSLTEFIAPSTLRSIGYCAFYCCPELTRVVFDCPDLEVLDDGRDGRKDRYGTFSGCGKLAAIRLQSQKLKTIPQETFADLKALTSKAEDICFEMIEHIGDAAFKSSSLAGNVTLRAIKTIGSEAFRHDGGGKLEEICIESEDIEEISAHAFFNQKAVTNLTLSIPNVKIIGRAAFGSLTGKKGTARLELPKIEKIDSLAFYDCYLLRDLRIDSPSLTEIGEKAFATEGGSKGTITNILLRAPNLVSVGTKAFAEQPHASDVGNWQLDSLMELGERMFRNNVNMTGVLSLPSVTNVKTYVFWDVKKLNGISFGSPEKLMISDNNAFAFNGTTAIDNVVLGTKEPLPNPGCMTTLGNVKNITFWGPAQTAATLNSFLEDATNYKTRLIVSKRQAGWTDLITPLTDADKARADYPADLEAQGKIVLGTTVGKLNKTVWVVHSPSPYDSKGLSIVVR